MEIESSDRVAFRKLFDQIRAYKRAFNRFVRAYPSPQQAEALFDREYRRVMALLDDERIQKVLNEHISAALSDAKALSVALGDGSKRLEDLPLRKELSLADQIGFSKTEANMFLGELSEYTADAIPSDVSAIIRVLRENHRNALIRINEERPSAARSSGKPKRKRDVKRAALSTIFGVGMIGLNLPSFAVGSPLAFSLALAGTCLHQAGRDLVGEPPK